MSKSNETTPNVPTLRFPNFVGAWQKTSMENVCSFSKGYGISKDNLTLEGTPCILYGELYTTYKTAIAKKIKSKTNLNPKNLFHSKKNDVIIPCSSEIAENIATSVCIPYDDVLLGGDLTVIRSNLDGAFLCNQLNSKRKYDIIRLVQGTTIAHLRAVELKKIDIVFPLIKEQRKISGFIDLIDNRIAVQNKIIEDLKILKKELCNKVFNCSFCNSEIQIREVANIYGGYAFSSKTYVERGHYKIITIGNVTGEHFVSGEYNTIDNLPRNLQKEQILDDGDILISLTGNVGRISLVNGEKFLLNQRVAKLAIEDRSLKEYMYQYLSHSSFEKDMQNAGQGAAQKNIKNADILSYRIHVPSKQESLDKIVTLFLTYDKKIENETKIFNFLLCQKSYLVNAMFI